MTASATARSKIFIGAAFNAVPTQDDYEAQSWVEIGQTTDLGSFGGKSKELTSIIISDPYVRKYKGSIDSGSIELTVDRDAFDAGQIAAKAAAAATSSFLFKVILNDKPTSDGTPTVYYFRAVVLSQENKLGNADTIISTMFTLSITGEIIEVPADVTIVFSPVAGALAGGTHSSLYAGVTIAATGGLGVVSYAVTTGTLPTGLMLNSATGVISGTPTAAATYDFTITATFADAGEDHAAYSIVVA